MRFPLNFLLYTASAGLLGFAGYTFYRAVKEGGPSVYEGSHKTGQQEADNKVASGKGQGPVTSSWTYDPRSWGERFKGPNLTGKEPVVDKPPDEAATPVVKAVDLRPLKDIIELLSVVCDTSTGGKGGRSHVVLRYAPTVNVETPRWYQLANQPAPSSPSSPVPSAADRVAGRRGGGAARGAGAAQPTTTMPASTAGQEIQQVLWVAGDGTPRFESHLWPPFADIQLVEVKSHARSAVFKRAGPPTADGKPGPEVTEELLVSALDLDPMVWKVIEKLAGADTSLLHRPDPRAGSAVAQNQNWEDVAETTARGNKVIISRKDQKVMEASPETILDRINLEPWRSRTGSGATGLRVVNVDASLQRFGIEANDVLMSINGEPVSTLAQARVVGKRQYERGVRTFVGKFLTGDGRYVERTYLAPDR
jgi:hypothetical protein